MERHDDFSARRGHLEGLSEARLEERFWELAERITAPLVELAKTHTTPSIERSVLLRMGFSGAESAAIVEGCLERGRLGKGAGHVVLVAARDAGLEIRDAGLALAEGRLWDVVERHFAAGGAG